MGAAKISNGGRCGGLGLACSGKLTSVSNGRGCGRGARAGRRAVALGLLISAGFGFAVQTSSPAEAAAIAWTNGTFNDNSILPAASSVVYAIDAGGADATSASGISFAHHTNYQDTATDTRISFDQFNGVNNLGTGSGRSDASTGDAGFDTVLNNALDDYNSNPSGQITLKQLVPNTAYHVLLLTTFMSNPPFGNPISMTASDGTNSSGTQRFSYPTAGQPRGGYIDGTFTADNSTQSLFLTTTPTAGGYISAVVLSTATPEPASLGLLAAGGAALLARRRRRCR